MIQFKNERPTENLQAVRCHILWLYYTIISSLNIFVEYRAFNSWNPDLVCSSKWNWLNKLSSSNWIFVTVFINYLRIKVLEEDRLILLEKFQWMQHWAVLLYTHGDFQKYKILQIFEVFDIHVIIAAAYWLLIVYISRKCTWMSITYLENLHNFTFLKICAEQSCSVTWMESFGVVAKIQFEKESVILELGIFSCASLKL